MDLAFCLFRYFPYGGLQRAFLRIARECLNRGHHVRVYVLQWDGEKPEGMEVEVFSVRGITNHRRYHRFSGRVLQELADRPADVVVGFNRMPGLDVYYAADTCYEARTRMSRPWWYRYLPRYRFFSGQERAVFAEDGSTEILLISERQKADFVRYYGTREDRFHLLPHGISRDRIAPSNAADVRKEFRREFRISEDESIILALGSGFKTKGLDRSILALGSLPETLKTMTRLMVVGLDDARPFRRLADGLGVGNRVFFMGGRDDVPRFLLGCDLLLHPAYNESAGMALFEAMAAGLPVLATDTCGNAPYVQQAGAGRIIPSPFEQDVLNRNLADMLTSSQRDEWKENGIRFAKSKVDLFSLPERAADIIEDIGRRKLGL